MELDLTKVMILLQRRYGAVREIYRLTKELGEAFERNDEVSASMLLQMRADEMEKADVCINQIWEMGGTERRNQEKLRVLMQADPSEAVGESPDEKKIYEIRQKIREMAEELRSIDQRMSQSVAREKSFYKTNAVRVEDFTAQA